ncbi:Sec39 domain-containing protein [Scheffersomyces amazonensis]|uniref:Sec39 domain-containing protein n=1 Tax=Scheffersomyces amazonensis TaxID=1078765 RepID=UPI00315CD4E3
MSDIATNYEIVDATTYVCIVSVLSSGISAEEVIEILNNLRIHLYGESSLSLQYTTINHILDLILIYADPTTYSLDSVVKFVQTLVIEEKEKDHDHDHDSSDKFNDLEELVNWISNKESITIPQNNNSILKTASDTLLDTSAQINQYFFTINPKIDSPEEILFTFVKAKVLKLSSLYNDISNFQSLFRSLYDFQPFKLWYNGLIQSYSYYWDNYASISNDSNIILLQEFLKIDNLADQFNHLIAPLSQHSFVNDKISIENWLTHVILPLITYHNNDYDPLLVWLFFNPQLITQGPPSKKYSIWKHAIHAIISLPHTDIDGIKQIIEYYLASCYYYALYYEDDERKVSSIEQTKIYDDISNTLQLITTEKSPIDIQFNFTELPHFDSFGEFIKSPENPIRNLFIEADGSSIAFLKQILITCQELYPINKLTISKYLHFKYSIQPISIKEKEILLIFSGINSINLPQLLKSVNLFMINFVTEPQDIIKIKNIIIGRLLFSNFFDIVESTFAKEIDSNTYFNLVLEKFWDSINNASNINDKIGKLHDAAKCLELFDNISKSSQLNEINQKLIIRFKHLFRAMNNMKNFKISVEKNLPFTPYQLIHNFGGSNNNSTDNDGLTPIKLINIILEQNPKSYLAFEKLYRILNDLLLYFDINNDNENSTYYFNKLKSACIESALIDNNFQFAYNQCIELLNHYQENNSNLNDIWLTFYQVGKYISPNWYEDELNEKKQGEKIEIWLKQRQILSRTLEFTCHLDTMADNSKVIINQWERINEQLQEYFDDNRVAELKTFQSTNHLRSLNDVKENIGSLANEIITDATTTTNQASEKLSNLFVSGLGWAIGANHPAR